jgi:hypothetical protein
VLLTNNQSKQLFYPLVLALDLPKQIKLLRNIMVVEGADAMHGRK